jgi:hypothetical protein
MSTHPKCDDTFRNVWKAVAMSDPFRDTEKDEELRTTIILKMVNLVRSGVTNPDELRVQTLKSLSL